MTTHRWWIVFVVTLAAKLLCGSVAAAPGRPTVPAPAPQFSLSGGVLTITTPRWQVRWQSGSLIGPTNRKIVTQ